MGELADFLDRIKSDPRVERTRFSQPFIEDVGNVLEKRGFNEARLFVWEHKGRGDLERQVETLLLLLDEMEKVKRIESNRSIGKYILKNKLNLLLK